MATYYWVGGSGTWDNVTTTNWAASSGGAGGAGVPNNTDTALFDANSGTAATVTVTATATCLNTTINKSDINLSLSGSPTFAGTTTLVTGTITLNTYTLTCLIFSSNFTTARTIAFGTGNITLTGNNNTIWNMADVSTFTYTGTPTVNATYSGSTGTRTINHGATAGGTTEAKAVSLNVTAGTDTVTITASSGVKNINFTGFAGTYTSNNLFIFGNAVFSAGMSIPDGATNLTFTSASSVQTLTSNGNIINRNVQVTSVTLPTNQPVLELADALNLGARFLNVISGTLDTKGYNVTCSSLQGSANSGYQKTIKLNNSTVTFSIGVAFSIPNIAFDADTSSIVLTGASTQLAFYYRANYTFYNVSFTNSAATSIFMPNSGSTVTFNNLSFPNATTTSYGVVMGGNIKVNGTLTLPTGSSYINRVTFYSVDGSTINAAAISGTLTDVDFRGITVTGPTAPWTGTRLGDGGGNSGITGFEAPKTVYWSLAGGGNWSATAWATSSGGVPALANYPILGDTVVFDDAGLNTSATVTVDRAFAINNLDFSARSNAMTFAMGVFNHEINGNFTASSAITFSGTAPSYFGGWSGTSTFTSAGRTITFPLRPSAGPNGTLVFGDNFTSSAALASVSGNCNLAGKTFSISQFIVLFSTSSVINLAGATITATGANPVNLLVGQGGAGYKTFTGTCTFNCSSASAKSINNGAMADLSGFTFVNTGAGALTFTNPATPGFNDGQYGTYGDIQTTVRPATINFTAGQTFQFNRFTISGTSGNLVTLQSSTAGTRATLLSPNAVNSVSFCSIKDLNAINTMGYGEWQAYTTNGNVDAGNNTGWLFSPATPSTAPRPTIRLRSLAQRGNMT